MDTDVLIFDGDCNLCNNTVQFILKRNKDICFASMQSPTGIALLKNFELSAESLNTLVFIQNNTIHLKSDGVLQIVKRLHGLWPVFYVFVLIPKFIRDKVYDIVAVNRKNWFGKDDKCLYSDEILKGRFL